MFGKNRGVRMEEVNKYFQNTEMINSKITFNDFQARFFFSSFGLNV